MNEVSMTVPIPAPSKDVWPLLEDFFGIGNFHPYITSVDELTESKMGVGTSRRCHFVDGTQIVETVIEWQDKVGYKIDLSDYKLPVKWAQAELRILESETGSEVTEVMMTMRYQMKFGPLGILMHYAMLRPMITSRFRNILRALGDYAQGLPVVKFAA